MNKNSIKDYLFNKNDCILEDSVDHLNSLEEPKDYMKGLNDSSIILPQNIILFRRDARFRGGDAGASHSRFVLITSLQGEGAVIIDGNSYFLKPNKGILVQPYQFHRYSHLKKSKRMWLFITFDSVVNEQLEFLRNKSIDFDPFALILINRIIHSYKREDSRELTLLTATLLDQLIQLSKDEIPREDKQTPNLLDETVSKSIAYIHNNLGSSLMVYDIACEVGLSESHLRAKFKQIVGVGLGAYVRQIRLHKASVLLSVSKQSISEISCNVGFDSLYSFSRTFKNEFHLSPSQFRKKHILKK
jgi:AraC family transcriptional regulator